MVACVVLLGLGGYFVVFHKTPGDEGPFRCVVEGKGDQDPYELEPQMIRNAATIEAVAATRDLPHRAVTIALATAMQESMLRNIDYGDKDSVGLFQQRPSQGWGSVEEIMDPVYSAGKFYDHLVEVPDYTKLRLTDAAQRVQRSAFPLEYAKHEPRAAQLTAVLTGRAQAGLNCSGKRPGDPVVGDATKVRAKLTKEHGPGLLPPASPRPGGKGGGARESTLTIQVPPDDAKAGSSGGKSERSRRGWQLAHWSLANASQLGVRRIAYDGLAWDASEASSGWQQTDERDGTGVRLALER